MNIEKIKKMKTEIIGKNILFFEEIDSTQKEAMRLINKKEITNGTIIISKKQTDGVGTHGRKWITENNGNIAMTIVLFPKCNISKFKNLTVMVAKCIVETIKKLYKINLEIKEPNDIMYNNLKLGGILTQCKTNKEIVKQLVIGIGFNVNQLQFPSEIQNIATSLKKEFKNIEFVVEDIINEFCEIFEEKFILCTKRVRRTFLI